MAIIRAKILDSRHLELSEDIPFQTKEIFLKILEQDTVESIRGAWGIDIDSAEFVERIRKSKSIEPI